MQLCRYYNDDVTLLDEQLQFYLYDIWTGIMTKEKKGRKYHHLRPIVEA